MKKIVKMRLMSLLAIILSLAFAATSMPMAAYSGNLDDTDRNAVYGGSTLLEDLEKYGIDFAIVNDDYTVSIISYFSVNNDGSVDYEYIQMPSIKYEAYGEHMTREVITEIFTENFLNKLESSGIIYNKENIAIRAACGSCGSTNFINGTEYVDVATSSYTEHYIAGSGSHLDRQYMRYRYNVVICSVCGRIISRTFIENKPIFKCE